MQFDKINNQLKERRNSPSSIMLNFHHVISMYLFKKIQKICHITSYQEYIYLLRSFLYDGYRSKIELTTTLGEYLCDLSVLRSWGYSFNTDIWNSTLSSIWDMSLNDTTEIVYRLKWLQISRWGNKITTSKDKWIDF